jgi:ParB/RepB/Spo0J family partition protein
MGLVVTEIELDKLYISPLNVRRDPGDLDELIDSITERGVLAPLLVRRKGEQYEVYAGSRRLQAARRAGHSTIPCIVGEVTDLQVILISLIENVQRKDLSLDERVETYKALQLLDPEYSSHRAIAKAISRSHQKISQDFQAYEILEKLQPHGFSLASDLTPAAEGRQQGKVLPEYHAVLLHQVLPYLVADEIGTVEDKLVQLATTIAPMSQSDAKAYIAGLKGGGSTTKTLPVSRTQVKSFLCSKRRPTGTAHQAAAHPQPSGERTVVW